MAGKIHKIKIIENEQIPNDINYNVPYDISLLDNSINKLDIYIDTLESQVEKMNINTLNDTLVKVKQNHVDTYQSIQKLINHSEKISNLCNLMEESIVKKQIELEKQTKLEKQNNKKINNLAEMILNLTNQDQIKRLQKILPDNEDYAKVYLQGFTPNTNVKKPNLIGTIKILGQYNFTKNERESYEIKVLQNEPTTFWCSCIDHKLNSGKKKIVCKHIAFVVCKVIQVLELNFFDSKKLTSEQLQLLLAKFSDKSELWKNKDFVRHIKEITLDTFKNFPSPIDDVCTFCYDQMTEDDKPIALCCPMCNHCFHSECMDIWLENYSKCTVCSSEFWTHYNVVKKGGKINITNQL
jgi:hypothetical protein